MKKNRLSFFRLDEQVVFTMAAVCLFSLFILGFKMISRKECKEIIITSDKDSILLNSTVGFTAVAEEGKEFIWDFGDRTPTFRGTLSAANHTYKKPGNYTISVIVNGKCTGIGKLYVRPDQNKAIYLPIIFSSKDTALVGEPIKFWEGSGKFTSFQWKFGDNNYIDPRGNPDHSFSFEGRVVISLQVDGDPALVAEKEIYIKNLKQNNNEVKRVADFIPPRKTKKLEIKDDPIVDPLPTISEKPPVEEVKKEPEVRKPSQLGPAEFAQLIGEIMDEKKNMGDIQKLLCDKTSPLVIMNNEQMSINTMCNKLKKYKSKKVKSLQVSPHYENGCLDRLQINFKNPLLKL